MKRVSKPTLALMAALLLDKLAIHRAVGRGYGYHGDGV